MCVNVFAHFTIQEKTFLLAKPTSMEEVQSWLANGYSNSEIFSQSPSLTSSAATSHETHSTPTLCDDSSFNSLESINASHSYNYPIPKQNISHICIASIKTTTPQISCLAIDNNNLYAASVKEVNVFDLATFSLIETFGSGLGSVKCIAFSNKRIFTSHQDCKIRVWQQVISSSSRQKHQLISTLPTSKDRFFNCLFAKNYVEIRRHKQKLWIEHADAVSGLAVNNDAGLMYSVSWDKSFKIWKISSDMRCSESVKAHSDAVNAVFVSPLDGTVYTASADGHISVWKNTKKHKLLTTLIEHESSVNALALSRDGSTLYSGGSDGVIRVWEKGDSDENSHFFVACSLKGHCGAILCLVCVNGVVISGSSDRSVRIWKYGKDFGGSCLATMEGHCKPVKSLVAIPGGDLDDGFSVLSGSLDGEIRAWKIIISDEGEFTS